MRLLKKGEKSIPLGKQKEIFNNLAAERTREIEKQHDSINFRDMIYHFKGLNKDIDFTDFIPIQTLFDDIKSKKVIFEYVEKN